MLDSRTCLLASFLLMAAGCEDGGGQPTRLYFGMENSDTCSRLDIVVDLQNAGAQVGRLGNGSLDCALSATLITEGCEASFTESSDGRGLRVEITECEDVWEGAFFECGFDRVDLSTINASINADCDCAHEPNCFLNGPTCYRDPGICATEDPSGDGCEHCDNDVDDDGDNQVDCDDPKCFYDCGVGLTTITCTTSTMVTTTFPPTTTSLLSIEEETNPGAVLYGDGSTP